MIMNRKNKANAAAFRFLITLMKQVAKVSFLTSPKLWKTFILENLRRWLGITSNIFTLEVTLMIPFKY